MIGDLPESLTVNGVKYDIRTNFKDILNILVAFNDPELKDEEKIYVCLFVLYVDFPAIPKSDYEAAYAAALRFIDCGMDPKKDDHSPRTLDWEQDASILFPAVNKVAGFEVRSVDYLHWWTFMGYFMEIGDGTFSHVLNLRHKKAKGKKLEKWEREFWTANKSICVLQEKLTAEEQAAKDRLNAMLK